jgi:hypothetical protein
MVSCAIDAGEVFTGMAETEVPGMFSQYSCKIVPPAVVQVLNRTSFSSAQSELLVSVFIGSENFIELLSAGSAFKFNVHTQLITAISRDL